MINDDCDKHDDDNCDDDCSDNPSCNVSMVNLENLMFPFSIRLHVSRLVWEGPVWVLGHESYFAGFFATVFQISIGLLNFFCWRRPINVPW